ncbi:MAG: crossover junction endodeoxyribonuclease RuvC [Armatimonadetes bacterium]|nr:crossover junction endodeoxyribonuclease RuvC [Armatimonadota bacterium]MBS1728738.1 crossover junction endodeoxyribonuclease RuvC [Armatimonadota bacterium]
MLTLGIDPGLERVGFGVVRRVGSKIECIDYGLIKTPKIALPERLKMIHDGVLELIEKHHPDAMATERLLFTKNVTTGMDVAKALGTVLLAAADTGMQWSEYSPPEVKQAVVGNGNADKKQITFMVRRLLALKEDPKPDDVADALAIAICHSFRATMPK